MSHEWWKKSKLKVKSGMASYAGNRNFGASVR